MTAARRPRTDPTQPELPLQRSPVGPGHPGRDREWKLDDRTRQIGLRGVALARARLLGSDADAGGDPQGRGQDPSGRAA